METFVLYHTACAFHTGLCIHSYPTLLQKYICHSTTCPACTLGLPATFPQPTLHCHHTCLPPHHTLPHLTPAARPSQLRRLYAAGSSPLRPPSAGFSQACLPRAAPSCCNSRRPASLHRAHFPLPCHLTPAALPAAACLLPLHLVRLDGTRPSLPLAPAHPTCHCCSMPLPPTQPAAFTFLPHYLTNTRTRHTALSTSVAPSPPLLPSNTCATLPSP